MFEDQWLTGDANSDQAPNDLPRSIERYRLLAQLVAQRTPRRSGPDMSVQGLPAFRGPGLSREAPRAAERRNPGSTNRSWLPVRPPPGDWQGGGRWSSPDEIRQHAKEAFRLYKIHLDLGMSPSEAAAWAANAQAESGGNFRRQETLNRPRRDGSIGHGIFQVTHPARRANFRQQVGVPVEQSTEMQQLKFRDWELGNTYRNVGRRLRSAQTGPRPASAADLAEIIARQYEVPGDVDRTVIDRRNITNELLRLADPRR